MACEAEIIDSIIRVNCANCVFGSSLEDFDACFGKTIDKLVETKKVERVILAGAREHEYDFEQTKLLMEIADVYDKLVNRENILSYSRLGSEGCERCFPKRFSDVKFLVKEMLRKDPIGAYVKVKRLIRHELSKAKKESPECRRCTKSYVKNALLPIKEVLEKTKLIQMVKDKLHGYKLGDRSLYREIFHPLVRPNFMLTRYRVITPERGRLVDRYKINNTLIEIYKVPGTVRYYYHITPPEFNLSDEECTILEAARRQLAEYKPTGREFTHPETARETFMNMGRDLMTRFTQTQGLHFSEKELDELSNILARYTAGFGILEVLLKDSKVQDIYINSPIGTLPIYVFHDDFEECETNLIPTREDAEGWATRFRLFSGRPLDEANPVLDTELFVPGAKARVCAITSTLSPEGIGYSLRRHRERPWTYPLFLNVKYFDPLFAGLMSFLVSGSRSVLIAGGRSSGKTSLLSATLLEILKRFRIVTVEDSVTGDSQIVFERNGRIERNLVGRVIDELIKKYGCESYDGREVLNENPENIRVFSINSDGKVTLTPVKTFIRHKVKKDIFEITTRAGRRIKVTGDHSLFTLENGIIKPVKCKDLKKSDFLATPRILPVNNRHKKQIKILDHLEEVKDGYILGYSINNFISKHRKSVLNVAKKLGYSRITVGWWKKNNVIPCKVLIELKKLGLRLEEKKLLFKASKNSKPIPTNLSLDEILLTFIGLWLADGCYDKKSVIISVIDEDVREIVHKLGKKLNLKVNMHSDGFSLMLNSITLKGVMTSILNLKGNAFTKKIPGWVFNLSKEQIGYLLKGIFSGDGYITKYEVAINIASKDMLKDIQTLLLFFGVIGRIYPVRRDVTSSLRLSTLESLRSFYRNIGFLQKTRIRRLEKICNKKSTHDVTDVIPLSPEFKERMANLCVNFNVHDYITRNYNIGRRKLQSYVTNAPFDGNATIKKLEMLANSDIFWDQIRNIRHNKIEGYVYDFSVPTHENFICENILAHNTLEIPVTQFRNLGYNIERLKSRSVITRVEREMPADEALRTAIRLGDACLIVGEVRSSIPGDEEVYVVQDSIPKRVQIRELEGVDEDEILVPTLDLKKEFKVKLEKLKVFVKHPKRKSFIKIKTKTGREVTVTPDHSIFTLDSLRVKEIKADELKEGDPIIIPSKLPCGYNDVGHLDLSKLLKDFRLKGAEGYIRLAIKRLGWKKASDICKVEDIYRYLLSTQKTRIPISSFLKLMKKAGIEFDPDKLRIKRVTSNTLPLRLAVDEDFCRFLGYYLAEGYIDKEIQMTVISNSNEEILKDIVTVCFKCFDQKPLSRKTKGLGISTQMMISNSPLAHLLIRLGCGRISEEKRIPAFIYGLSERKISAFLRGLYGGDGCFTPSERSGNAIRYFTTSKQLANDLMYLLLTLGIVARIFESRPGGKGTKKLYTIEFKQRHYVKKFLKKVGFEREIREMIEKGWSHSQVNMLRFKKKELKEHNIKLPRRYRHLRRFGKCSKFYFERIIDKIPSDEYLKNFVKGDFYVDEINEIRKVGKDIPQYVYDLSVNPTENFVGGFGGILLHNTEAGALYEAMRIGALSNVVMGTIHGESPYGVFDRVVNDLGVPPASFKATDIIVICGRLRTADGLHTFRRVLDVTEVRKEWKEDPLEEGGFVNLMEYSAKEDRLKPTDTLINGESLIINEIAKRVKEWHGNWDAVWSNIELRGKVKQTIVDYANKLKRPEILEAGWTSKCNEMFHLICDDVRREVGFLDSKIIYNKWLEWFKGSLK